jgi:hypothetical protein
MERRYKFYRRDDVIPDVTIAVDVDPYQLP